MVEVDHLDFMEIKAILTELRANWIPYRKSMYKIKTQILKTWPPQIFFNS